MGADKLEIGEFKYLKFELPKAKTTSGFVTTFGLAYWMLQIENDNYTILDDQVKFTSVWLVSKKGELWRFNLS